MKDKTMIKVAIDFSEFPAGRVYKDGPYSGEKFREEFLVKSLEAYNNVQIDLDGTYGYGSSFLEEAFGGLIRLKKWTLKELKNRLSFISNEDLFLIPEIKSYMEAAFQELQING